MAITLHWGLYVIHPKVDFIEALCMHFAYVHEGTCDKIREVSSDLSLHGDVIS